MPHRVRYCLFSTVTSATLTVLVWAVLLGSSVPVGAQQLVVSDIATANFPQLTVRVHAFDAEGNPRLLDPQLDRIVTERLGVVRQTTAVVTCPPLPSPTPTTAVFAFDWTSDSIRGAAAAAIGSWFDAAAPGSEAGIVVFGSRPYVLADIGTDTAALLASVNRLPRLESAFPYRALLDSLLGAVAIAARGHFPRTVVLVTDHKLSSPPASLLQVLQTTGTRLVVVAFHRDIPPALSDLCTASGGLVLGGATASQLPRLFRMATHVAAGYQPCSVTWQSTYDCVQIRTVQLTAPSIGASTEFSYSLASRQIPLLDVLPRYRDLGTFPPGATPAQEFVLTALNADITLLAISSDPSVEIVEGQITAPLLLPMGQQFRIWARLRVDRPERTVGTIRIVSTSCSGVDIVTVAANVALPTSSALQITQPSNDTTIEYAGLPLRIRWIGAVPNDSLTLSVQQLGDTTWTVLADYLTTTEFTWRLPESGRYRFQVRNRQGTMSAESGIVIVAPPPFAFVPIVVPTTRSGTAVEFRPPQLICSDTSQPIRFDSLYFVSGRSFQLVRDVPDTVYPGQCATAWIRFAPTEPGLHADTLIAETPVGVRTLRVEAMATQPQLIVPATIRLGNVPLGTYRDTLVQWFACSTTPQQVRLQPVGPDSSQLQLLTIRQLSLTEETPCSAYPFGFRAERLGRTCLRLLVESSEGQPYECVLVGDVVCAEPYSGAMLSAPPTLVTQAGHVITVPVWMPSVPRQFRTMQRPYRFTVRCNASALLPEPPLGRGTIADGERIVTVTGRGFLRDDTLALLRFGTYWGTSPIVQLRIEDFQWLDDCSLALAPTSVAIVFTDYCTAGGTTRLFVDGSPPIIEQVAPQPSEGTVHLRLRVEQQMPVELRCLDVLGIERWHTELGSVVGTVEGTFVLDLPPGQYILQARSPFGTSSTIVIRSP